MQIKLHDGTMLEVEGNGNNYIPKKLNKKVFEDNTKTITIIDGEEETLLENHRVQFTKIGNTDAFIFVPISREDIMQQRIDDLELLVLTQDESIVQKITDRQVSQGRLKEEAIK